MASPAISSTRGRFALFALAFTLSGFAGLVYESVWSQYLKLFLGHAAYAQVLVLSIFMGGLAAGAWLAGRYGPARRRLLLGYAAAEGLIGIMALWFHEVFVAALAFAYDTVLPALAAPLLIFGFKWTLATLLILPQALLLGATFPLMSAGLIRRAPQRAGYALAVMYFANSLGAAIGVLVSGFLLIGTLGLPGTSRVAGILNLLIALMVWALAGHRADPSPADSGAGARPAATSGFRGLFIAAAFTTGAASFLYEVGWIRMLSLVLGSSGHAFELMLAAFILGLALGGWFVRRHLGPQTRHLQVLGLIQIAMGCCALLTLPFYEATFALVAFAVRNLAASDGGYLLYQVFSHAVALIVMLPATILAGMTLPLITHCLLHHNAGEASIGQVYAANTIGAVVGIALGLGVLMPWLGLESLILGGGLADVLLGVVLVGLAMRARQWSWRPLPGLAAAAAAMVVIALAARVEFDPVVMASGVFLDGRIERNREILYHADGRTASITVARTPGHQIITTNGKIDAAIADERISKDEPTMTLLGALPLALRPDARHVAVIGMGSGMTTHVLLGSPSLARVDTIEIEPAMVRGARLFGAPVARSFDDPRSHIHIEDAKAFFSQHHEPYDVIVSEPSNPWVSGIADLFSLEFYENMSRYLDDDGILIQWMQIYHMNVALLAPVVKALSTHFADYQIYALNNTDLAIVAVPAGQVPVLDARVFSMPLVRRDLAAVGISGLQDLEHRRMGSRRALQPYFDTFPGPANSDYYPVLGRGADRARFLGQNAVELHRFRLLDAPLLEVLEQRGPRTEPTGLDRNLHLHTAGLARQAMALRDAISRRPATVQPDADTARLAAGLRALHHDCDVTLLTAGSASLVHDTAALVIPWLSPAEALTVWDDLRGARCHPTLPSSTRYWIDLYRALSARDFPTARRLAESGLPVDRITATRRNNYLLTVAILAALHDEDQAGAKALWQRYADRETDVVELRALRGHIERRAAE